jgi:hypothetical protein
VEYENAQSFENQPFEDQPLEDQSLVEQRTTNMGETSMPTVENEKSYSKRQSDYKSSQADMGTSSATKQSSKTLEDDTGLAAPSTFSDPSTAQCLNGSFEAAHSDQSRRAEKYGTDSHSTPRVVVVEPRQPYVPEHKHRGHHREQSRREQTHAEQYQEGHTQRGDSHHDQTHPEQGRHSQSHHQQKMYHERDVRAWLQEAEDKCFVRDRQIQKLQEQVSQLQLSRMSGVDRFEPAMDSDIEKEYLGLNNKVYKVAQAISKLESKTLKPDEWVSKVMSLSWTECYNKDIKTFDRVMLKDCKKMLMGLIWKFLNDELFVRPFLAFSGHENGEVLDTIYQEFFNDPCKTLNNFSHCRN